MVENTRYRWRFWILSGFKKLSFCGPFFLVAKLKPYVRPYYSLSVCLSGLEENVIFSAPN